MGSMVLEQGSTIKLFFFYRSSGFAVYRQCKQLWVYFPDGDQTKCAALKGNLV